jgi:DNA polymerase-3 subunit alpha
MYTPLFIKSDYALLKSMIKIDDLINFAINNNIKSLALTDDNLHGSYEFYSKCKKNNIKPIIGLEIKIDNNKIVLYAVNYEGYKDLCKIVTLDVLNIQIINNYKENIIPLIPYLSLNIYDSLEHKIKYKTYENKDEINENSIYAKDILYLNKEDALYYKYLRAIDEKLTFKELKDEYLNNYLYLEKDLEFDLTNNFELTNKCNLELPFHLDLLPTFTENPYETLKKECMSGMRMRFGSEIGSKYIERLKYELDVINKMGFSSYFLIVNDYVKYAKENDILVGPGRGSAASSLVSYTLGITEIDPLKYDLLFERFLNPERISMPDIDIDFEDTKRDDIITYLRNKYGTKKVCQIITFGTLGAKQIMQDIARILEIDIKNINKKINATLSLKENLPNIKDLLNKNIQKVYDIALKLEGLKRHKTVHAAGIVISPTNMDEIIPLTKYNENTFLTGLTAEYLEQIGFLKMDLLALKNLSFVAKITKEIGLNFNDIPLNEFNIFQKGLTLGIFQFESKGIISFLKKLKPTTFDDIVSAIALYRPGPIDNIASFIKRKEGLEKINYFHPNLEAILKPTYGIIIYQEQIMLIAKVLANYSLAEADLLRKAMSKKKKTILLDIQKEFIARALKNGYEENLIKQIFSFILKFAEYGFNKAHSVSYAFIASKMAYLKSNYPLIFMKELLNANLAGNDKLSLYINECKLLNIKVMPPDVNTSLVLFTYQDDKLIFPLKGIKNLSIGLVNTIIDNKPYTDIFDFLKKVPLTKEELIILNKAGALTSLNINRKTLNNNLDKLLDYSKIGSLLDDDSLKPIIINETEFKSNEIMAFEAEVFGFYLSKDLLTEKKLTFSSLNIADLKNYFDKYITFVAIIDKVREISTKDNKPMAFLTLSDETDKIEGIVFPSTYEEIKIPKALSLVLIKGKLEKRFDEYQVIIKSIEDIT